jgi:tRNA-2-methylthio-N6-dimethylallyladenosine synthase
MQNKDNAIPGDKPVNPKKVFIRTFGCQMNEYDSDKMLDVLGQERGVVVTNTPEDADVILFNTCSVREKAQEKVFSDLGRVKHLKALNPDLVIGVGGCVASQEGASIVDRAPCARRDCFCIHHGRLQQILQLLCRTLHPW